MKKSCRYFIILGLLFSSHLALAQGKFNLEIYGGPLRSYNQVTFNPNQPNIDAITPWNLNLGVNFLTRIKPNLQLSVQAELARNRQRGINYPNFPALNPSFEKLLSAESFGNYSVGLRYNWNREKYSFFVQPSIGFTVNNFSEYVLRDSLSGSYTITNKQTEISPNLRLETGFKLYTRRKNYFLVGLRHQQGLQELNPRITPDFRSSFDTEISRKGSYSSLFVGYGINFENWSKSKRAEFRKFPKESKEVKRDRAWNTGSYIIAGGFLRFRSRSEREPNLQFSNMTSVNFIGLGYKFKDFSIESGYSSFWISTPIFTAATGVITTFNTSNVNAIPLTFKYDFEIGDKNRLRVGPTFSAYYITGTGDQFRSEGAFSGSDYFLNYKKADTDLSGKIFFNAGVYAELPIFNSSLINFKISQNFGSPQVGVIDLTGDITGTPVNFESSGSLNGLMLELGYKLPLNLIFKPKRIE